MKDYWHDFLVVEKGQESLGGNLTHGDTHSMTPALWRCLVDRFAVRSLLDIGAGEGQALLAFHRMGVIAHGIDGLRRNVRNSRHPITLHNLKHGPYYFPCDMTYCVEVAEHIEAEYVGALVKTLSCAPVVVMTHGLPGQKGYHHVNLQHQPYWEEKMAEAGYRLSIDNEHFRAIASAENEQSYFSISGLVFLKKIV